MLSATRQNTIMDIMLPAIAGDRRMSRLLAQLVFILAGGTLLAASAQFKVMVPPSPVPITGQTLVVLMIGMDHRAAKALPSAACSGTALAMVVGTLVIYLFGYAWMPIEAGRCGLPDAGCLAGRQGR